MAKKVTKKVQESQKKGRTKTIKRDLLDWELIERDYRAGILSIRQVAKKHGCSDMSVRRKAKKNDWERDLTVPTIRRAKQKLTKKPVKETLGKEEEIIEESADLIVQVLTKQQKRAKETGKLNDILKELVRKNLNKKKKKVDYQTLNVIARILKDIGGNEATIQAIEQKAFNLDSKTLAEVDSDLKYQDVAGEEKTERLMDMGDRLIEELNKRS